ncbi:MAG TPA: hypothetical protein VGT01_06115 [Candidatus Dormibacteraeota bacterium]|nr:hypothetical protein [Candidatus Dormibacteraeota bacterium]
MGTLVVEIDDEISARRRMHERSLDDMRDLELPRVPAGLVAAGAVTGIVALGIVGWLLYRSSRRKSLMQRLQDALPDKVRELPQAARTRWPSRLSK